MANCISVKEAAEYTGYTAGHLRYLLSRGLVRGRKCGRDWFTTKETLDKYPGHQSAARPQEEELASCAISPRTHIPLHTQISNASLAQLEPASLAGCGFDHFS